MGKAYVVVAIKPALQSGEAPSSRPGAGLGASLLLPGAGRVRCCRGGTGLWGDKGGKPRGTGGIWLMLAVEGAWQPRGEVRR